MSPAKILAVDDEPDFELLLKQRFRQRIRKGELAFRFAPQLLVRSDRTRVGHGRGGLEGDLGDARINRARRRQADRRHGNCESVLKRQLLKQAPDPRQKRDAGCLGTCKSHLVSSFVDGHGGQHSRSRFDDLRSG